MQNILQAWREGGYQPSPGLLDTVAAYEAGPLRHWIEQGLGRYRMSTHGPRDAVESSRPPGYSLTGWSIILGAAMLCEPSRTAGRADTDRVRRVVARFLDNMSGREDEGTTVPPAAAELRPEPESKRGRGRGRAKSALPPPPEEEPEVPDDESSGPSFH